MSADIEPDSVLAAPLGDVSAPTLPLHGAPLLVNDGGAGWMSPATTAWDNEATLRDLLVANPSLMPGVSDPAVAAIAEFRIPGVGRADVIAVESNGAITVCEAKLSTNAEMRRTIVGQVLAYVSGLAGMDLDDFEQQWTNCGGGTLVEEVLGTNAAESDVCELRRLVGENLAAGRLRVMLAVDVLSAELRSIIGYLALHTDVDVVALEVSYARSGSVEILIPRTYGTELSAARATTTGGQAGRSGHRVDVADAIDSIDRAAEQAATGYGTVVRSVLMALGDRIGYLYSGQANILDPVVVAAGTPSRQPAKIITTQRTIGIRVCFHWCQRLETEQLDQALAVLERHPAIKPSVSGVREAQFRRGPLLGYEGVLDQPGAVAALIECLTILSTDTA